MLKSNPVTGPWILPANVCPIVALTFLKAGVEFELLDIDAETLSLGAAELLHRVTAQPKRYGGLLFVHTYGRVQPVDGLFKALHREAPSLTIVDDRCVCRPSFDAPESDADLVLYSTGYAKPIDIGYGGFAFVRDTLACDPLNGRYVADDLEALTAMYKSRIAAGEPISAAAGDWLDLSTPQTELSSYRQQVEATVEPAWKHRERLSAIYRKRIPTSARLAEGDWRFQIRVPRRDRLLTRLFEADLFAGAHYAPLTGILGAGSAPTAAALHAEIVNLFNDRYYTAQQAEQTAAIVCDHLDTNASDATPHDG